MTCLGYSGHILSLGPWSPHMTCLGYSVLFIPGRHRRLNCIEEMCRMSIHDVHWSLEENVSFAKKKDFRRASVPTEFALGLGWLGLGWSLFIFHWITNILSNCDKSLIKANLETIQSGLGRLLFMKYLNTWNTMPMTTVCFALDIFNKLSIKPRFAGVKPVLYIIYCT